MTPRDFANTYLQPYKTKGEELVPQLCPFCHGGDHRDKYTFALNEAKETYNCKRGTCGAQGHFSQLLRQYGIDVGSSGQYKAPKEKPRKITEQATGYLRLRKISNATMAAYQIGADAQGNIMFPYLDEKGVHVFNKFRYPRKLERGERKAWREAGTKPILFGMHLCDTERPLVICEGEIDAMSCHTCGIANAVSVPSGAEDLTWVDTCWDFLDKFSVVYLFGDNDAPGREMIHKLSVRLSGARVYVVEHIEKDANALLYLHGPEAVCEAYVNAREVPVSGLLNLANVQPIDVKNMPRAHTSIIRLNTMLGGFMMGDLSIWTGKRAEGKSTLLSGVMLDAVDGGHKVCAYSGELRADRFQYWVDLQAAGKTYVKSYFDPSTGRDVYYVPARIRDMIHTWYDGKFWLYDNNIALENEEATVLSVFEQAARRHDCKVFLIDNLMTVDYGENRERDFYLQQGRFVNQLAAFANAYNAHVHLVAHPRKTEKRAGINDNDDVGGSGAITNRAANVISVNRSGDETIGFDLSVNVMKNRWNGTTGAIGLCFEPTAKRIYSPAEGDGKRYGWERENFVEIEQIPAFEELA